MNELLEEIRQGSSKGEDVGADSPRETSAFSSRAYDKVRSGFPDTSGSVNKRHQKDRSEIGSDYRPGLARPHINRPSTNTVREIVVEDDDIPELRRQQGYSKDRNHAEEMQNMLNVLNHDVLGKGAIHTARDVYAASSAERTDELSLQLSCLPAILKEYDRRRSLKTTEVPFVSNPRYITPDRINKFCKTPTCIDATARLQRLFFAKRIGRKSPVSGNDDFQSLMQLAHPEDELPSIQHFMRSVQHSMKLMFTHLYVMDKDLGKITVPDVYDNSANFSLGKCALIFMSMNERAFGLYILCHLRYEPKHRMKELREGDLVPRIAAARRILGDDEATNSGESLGRETGKDRLHELIVRYFGKKSLVKHHHATYNDIYGDGITDRSDLGALLESNCFRAQFLDAGFIPAVE